MDTIEHCAGCRDDFYNHNRMGLNEKTGEPRCWSLSSATLVEARDVPTFMPPPYLALPFVMRPSCYKAEGFVRVKAESLTAEGFWR